MPSVLSYIRVIVTSSAFHVCQNSTRKFTEELQHFIMVTLFTHASNEWILILIIVHLNPQRNNVIVLFKKAQLTNSILLNHLRSVFFPAIFVCLLFLSFSLSFAILSAELLHNSSLLLPGGREVQLALIFLL